jgi:hypothetical protein
MFYVVYISIPYNKLELIFTAPGTTHEEGRPEVVEDKSDTTRSCYPVGGCRFRQPLAHGRKLT